MFWGHKYYWRKALCTPRTVEDACPYKIYAPAAHLRGGGVVILFAYISIGAVNGVITCVIIPRIILTYSFPLLFRALEDYLRKAAAIFERRIAYARYTLTNNYARQAVAIIERFIAYTRYSIGYC